MDELTKRDIGSALRITFEFQRAMCHDSRAVEEWDVRGWVQPGGDEPDPDYFQVAHLRILRCALGHSELHERIHRAYGDVDTIFTEVIDGWGEIRDGVIDPVFVTDRRHILVVRDLKIEPVFEAHDVGEWVAAEAVGTLGRDCDLAVAVLRPPRDSPDQLSPARRRAMWKRLGFRRLPDCDTLVLELATTTLETNLLRLRTDFWVG